MAGNFDGPGDLFESFSVRSSVNKFAELKAFRPPTPGERWKLLRTAVRVGALGLPPAPPPEEMDVTPSGRKHSKKRDTAAVSHHYDVGNDFYALVLGSSMVYSRAVWEDENTGLDAAQEAKLDLVCRKLGLRPGMRVLDAVGAVSRCTPAPRADFTAPLRSLAPPMNGADSWLVMVPIRALSPRFPVYP
ncbi:hypothetical protein IWX75_003534 [Arthrobacter sp. CAN_A6]